MSSSLVPTKEKASPQDDTTTITIFYCWDECTTNRCPVIRFSNPSFGSLQVLQLPQMIRFQLHTRSMYCITTGMQPP
ncbi:hypothetical protein ATANTOWER_008828 [Ataeniobius toweri]|uniref:Uncharacterized protein n=1 Tax=Ataeniobius toweri TaxID=208326 RepID=A0ABU7AY66_9TELE|nr:hypothetical protein [Ataeniobius toweri]